jgi:hypothetical protein
VSEFLSELNSWIVNHSALTISVGLPVFGAAIAAWQTHLNYRLKRSELKLQLTMRLAEQRLQHFENLQDTIKKLLSLLADGIVAAVSNERRDRTIDVTIFTETLKAANAVLIHTSLPESTGQEFMGKFSKVLDSINERSAGEGTTSNFVQLRELCGQVLRSERSNMELYIAGAFK